MVCIKHRGNLLEYSKTCIIIRTLNFEDQAAVGSDLMNKNSNIRLLGH